MIHGRPSGVDPTQARALVPQAIGCGQAAASTTGKASVEEQAQAVVAWAEARSGSLRIILTPPTGLLLKT